MIYDVAIIGAGPAGLSAALNAAIRNKSVIVLGPETSEKLEKTRLINNYLGLPQLSGSQLIKKMRDHTKSLPIEFLSVNATMVYDMGRVVGILSTSNTIIEARAVVYSPGVSFGKAIPGEEKYLGRGVGTCATCDAALYKGKKVVVVGYNDHSVEEANFIAELARETVFINRTGREQKLSDGIIEKTGNPKEIRGGDFPHSILLGNEEIFADGFFFIRDARRPDSIVPGIALSESHILVDGDMQTNLPGIFAAGDCTGEPYQIAKAVGQGQIAGLAAASFAVRRKMKEESASE